jgi:uncharacterized protein YkwD
VLLFLASTVLGGSGWLENWSPARPALAAESAATSETSSGVLPPLVSVERRMFEALNAERVRQGLTPVAWSSELGKAAALHSADMARNDYLEHESLDGSSPQDRAARQGYKVPSGNGWMVIEAISAMPSMEAALDWLLGDPLHHGVLMRASWREVGIGHASGGSYGNYWTLDFGCRPNVLPIFALPADSGKGLRLTFTNEQCAAQGGGPDQMGRATSFMLSTRNDFRGAEWEPYRASTTLDELDGDNLNVRFKDASGRESSPFRLVLDLGAGGAEASPSRSTSAAPTPTAAPKKRQQQASKQDEPRPTPSPNFIPPLQEP